MPKKRKRQRIKTGKANKISQVQSIPLTPWMAIALIIILIFSINKALTGFIELPGSGEGITGGTTEIICPTSPTVLKQSITLNPQKELNDIRKCEISVSNTGFFTIGANNIVINCNGMWLVSKEVQKGKFIVNDGYTGITIKNCILEDFDTAIQFDRVRPSTTSTPSSPSYLGNIIDNQFIDNVIGVNLLNSAKINIKQNSFVRQFVPSSGSFIGTGSAIGSLPTLPSAVPTSIGIRLQKTYNSVLEANTFSSLTSYAIGFVDSFNNLIKEGTIKDSGGAYGSIVLNNASKTNITNLEITNPIPKPKGSGKGLALYDSKNVVSLNTHYSGENFIINPNIPSDLSVGWYVSFKIKKGTNLVKDTDFSLYNSKGDKVLTGKTNNQGVTATSAIIEKIISTAPSVTQNNNPFTLSVETYSIPLTITDSGQIEIDLESPQTGDTVPPTVTLISPDDNEEGDEGDIELTCKATDDYHIAYLALYFAEESQDLEFRKSINDQGTSITHTFKLYDVEPEIYKWNCKASDGTNSAFASKDFTLIVQSSLSGGIIRDADGDGYTNQYDCNDNNFLINPGAEEICDGVDNDCNNIIDDLLTTEIICGLNIGQCKYGITYCIGGELGDCMGAINPSEEICDGVDNNCNGLTDEGIVCEEFISRGVSQSIANNPLFWAIIVLTIVIIIAVIIVVIILNKKNLSAYQPANTGWAQ